ncbi:hypothetical protein CROQUDRAFT_716771 [Cronartium quercuum f. sp. fusiforme G11]|uniref:Uncharacterized protein n=1 Tax=Cronartium quercuum f. sp. fusiforme G11 TaxID=708437 RepID=A0A9P6NEP4_9BASI|nr:hypothetical protein CROQUDRAFT_716771 [Cronartium quercuum f. sp. fusiforme G11]
MNGSIYRKDLAVKSEFCFGSFFKAGRGESSSNKLDLNQVHRRAMVLLGCLSDFSNKVGSSGPPISRKGQDTATRVLHELNMKPRKKWALKNHGQGFQEMVEEAATDPGARPVNSAEEFNENLFRTARQQLQTDNISVGPEYQDPSALETIESSIQEYAEKALQKEHDLIQYLNEVTKTYSGITQAFKNAVAARQKFLFAIRIYGAEIGKNPKIFEHSNIRKQVDELEQFKQKYTRGIKNFLRVDRLPFDYLYPNRGPNGDDDRVYNKLLQIFQAIDTKIDSEQKGSRP